MTALRALGVAQLLGQVIPWCCLCPAPAPVCWMPATRTRADLASFTVRTRMRTTP